MDREEKLRAAKERVCDDFILILFANSKEHFALYHNVQLS